MPLAALNKHSLGAASAFCSRLENWPLESSGFSIMCLMEFSRGLYFVLVANLIALFRGRVRGQVEEAFFVFFGTGEDSLRGCNVFKKHDVFLR